MMSSPIAIFAFNRPVHLQRTLEALAGNDMALESPLTIFCDGPRNSEEEEKTNAVRAVARATRGFASVRVIEREENMGLAPSIIAGVTAMLAENERVIVVEDDLVSSPYFLRYINEGLDMYAKNQKVASIHGWCFPNTLNNIPETFFMRGADCLGWGTWRRAWDIFEENASTLLQQLEEKKLNHAFNLDGAYDYIGMLKNVRDGRVSSWAVRWLASAYLAGMYTLYPGRSLIHHAGSDGSGTNCCIDTSLDVPLSTTPIVQNTIPILEQRVMRDALKKFFFQRSPQSIKRIQDSPEQNVWEGGYPDWASAKAASTGYDDMAIFEKVRYASTQVRDGKAVYERDSVLFEHIEYSWPMLAGIMWCATQHGGRVRIIDFGGALGSSYRQNKRFLDTLPHVRWCVVEQRHFVECGQKEFASESLLFYPSIEACIAEEHIDGILLSSVVQYMENPYALLETIVNHRFSYIILDRTCFDTHDLHSISVQRVPEYIYKASYPCHFLSRSKVEHIMKEQYTIIEWFDSTLGGKNWMGFIAKLH